MSSPLEGILLDRLRSGGPIPFGDYMDTALYHPEFGYYGSGRVRSGKSGDYITSPELHPAFAQLWARGFEQVWDDLGRPASFTVVEVGPGEGGFVRGLLDSVQGPFKEALDVRMVERIPALEQRQRARLEGAAERVTWHRDLEEWAGTDAGLVFGNEVLDNLPVEIVTRKEGAWLQLHVEEAGGRMQTTWRTAGGELLNHLDRTCGHVPDGRRVEVGLAAGRLVQAAGRRVRRGAMVWVDYGTGIAPRSDEGTLATYSRQGAGVDALADPGTRDITAHVDWDLVIAVCRGCGFETPGPRRQRRVLHNLGLRTLDSAAKTAHSAAVQARQGAEALRALSTRQALAALADPAGLGSLEVVVGTKGAPLPRFIPEDSPRRP